MPSKSNYSGRLHPRIWLGLARENGWRTLYDMSAELANLEEPQVSLYKPDFVPMSFYKMFGYPTGVGALLVRREAQSDLHKRWFAGGSILLVSVMMDFFAPEVSPHGRFEDGTTAFSAIAAVPMGLEFLRGHAGRGEHARGLGTRLRSEIERFGTGPDRIDLYSPGGTDVVTFGLYREGRYVDAWHVEIAARRRKIALRTGCFCNPGCNERVFAYPLDGVRDFWDKSRSDESLTIEALRPYTGNAPIGAVRASFGYANVGSDVDKIADFLREMLEVPVGALVGDDA